MVKFCVVKIDKDKKGRKLVLSIHTKQKQAEYLRCCLKEPDDYKVQKVYEFKIVDSADNVHGHYYAFEKTVYAFKYFIGNGLSGYYITACNDREEACN